MRESLARTAKLRDFESHVLIFLFGVFILVLFKTTAQGRNRELAGQKLETWKICKKNNTLCIWQESSCANVQTADWGLKIENKKITHYWQRQNEIILCFNKHQLACIRTEDIWMVFLARECGGGAWDGLCAWTSSSRRCIRTARRQACAPSWYASWECTDPEGEMVWFAENIHGGIIDQRSDEVYRNPTALPDSLTRNSCTEFTPQTKRSVLLLSINVIKTTMYRLLKINCNASFWGYLATST